VRVPSFVPSFPFVDDRPGRSENNPIEKYPESEVSMSAFIANQEQKGRSK
jgi:hypothetical protein